MTEPISELKSRFLERWMNAFDELVATDRYKALVKTYRYAGGPRYDLSRYENGRFRDKDDWTSETAEQHSQEIYSYGLNDRGLPCYMTCRHDYNKTTWAGFYSYSDAVIEHVGFSLNTGVPSWLQRIEYDKDKKLAIFSLNVNGGGSSHHYKGLSREAIAQRLNAKFDLLISINRLQYDESGKVTGADGIRTMPGLGHYMTRDEYAYDAENTLLTIRQFSDLGADRLIYSRISEATSAEMIIDDLSMALSEAVTDGILGDRQKEAERTSNPQIMEEPIGLVNLTYTQGECYYPDAGYQLVRTIRQDLEEGIFDFYSFIREADINTGHLQRLYAQLYQIMDEAGDANLGRVMLRKTAAILIRTKMHGRLPIAKDFGVIALDVHIDGYSNENTEEILLACGNDAATIALWKGKGMFSESAQ